MSDLVAHALLTHNPHIVGLIQSDRFDSLQDSESEAAYGGKWVVVVKIMRVKKFFLDSIEFNYATFSSSSLITSTTSGLNEESASSSSSCFSSTDCSSISLIGWTTFNSGSSFFDRVSYTGLVSLSLGAREVLVKIPIRFFREKNNFLQISNKLFSSSLITFWESFLIK